MEYTGLSPADDLESNVSTVMERADKIWLYHSANDRKTNLT